MNVLLLGSGGREHAFAWKIKQSKQVDELFVAPGNAGIASIAKTVKLDVNDFEAIAQFVKEQMVAMIVVGPEDPLVNGIYDYFKNHEELSFVKVIGPSKAGAELEGSKDFAKQFMIRNKIPTAKYQTFTKDTLFKGFQFLESLSAPYVLKADGLAGGKGVLILDSLDEAKRELSSMISQQQFGDASAKVVIEEFMKGIECSVFVLSDGINYKILPTAKDYKRIGEGDTGLNTGGMGAISPVPFVDKALMDKIEKQIIIPSIKGLQKEKITYKGFIYIGLMCNNGEPKVVEYNCRMGDPETEVVLPLIESDIIDLFESLESEQLDTKELIFSSNAACTVVLAAEGYPGVYAKGRNITFGDTEKSIVFHAGTKLDGPRYLTNGGRVLAVTSIGENLSKALENSYNSIQHIRFEGMYYRKDIGQDVM